jgi:hypothetical protein
MALKIPLSLRQPLDDAFDRVMRQAGLPPGFLGTSFSSLIEQGTDATPQFNVVSCNTVAPLSNLAVVYSQGEIVQTNQQSGSSYVALASDNCIFMSQDSLRTVSIPGASPAGTTYQVIDNSGSSTAGHTITVTATSGNIHGAASAVITPGTNKSLLLMSDGANYWLLSKF